MSENGYQSSHPAQRKRREAAARLGKVDYAPTPTDMPDFVRLDMRGKLPDIKQRTPYLMEPDFFQSVTGDYGELPDDVALDDAGQPHYRDDWGDITNERVPVAARGAVLPLSKTPGGVTGSFPLLPDMLDYAMPSAMVGNAARIPLEAGEVGFGAGAVGKAGKGAAKAPKGAGDLPAPAVHTDPALFDYGALSGVPDVPQYDLPRHQPARGVSARVGDLVNDSKVVRGVEETVDRGLLMGGREWYNNDQLRQRFVAEMGEDQGNAAFRRYMDMVAATSPRSRVSENARNASYYYMLDAQGLPMPGEGDKLPQPYGHMAQKLHKQNARGVVENGGWDVFQNPKPASFVENLVGNQRPATVDAHAFKLPALLARDPRFLATSYQSSKDAPRINPRKATPPGS